MKYMGSKRAMLQNGLGELLRTEAESADRIVDLFCGAASVSWFAATELGKPVVACDLQKYATTLAGSIIKRTNPISTQTMDKLWLFQAKRTRSRLKGWNKAEELDTIKRYNTATWRKRAQDLCSSDAIAESSFICRYYGGHYFSPTQALSLDAMLRTLPEDDELRDLCLAATIIAASCCAAAPGHTAQPFKATRTAAEYLRDAWQREPFHYASKSLEELCRLHADIPGETIVEDANQVAKNLESSDVVFVDPPYSAVQYSRFYHVLETIAQGTCSDVEGTGRYPPPEERPNSRYSRKANSEKAISDLLSILSANRCTVVLTFPETECSNGLSGKNIEKMAKELFRVKRKSVKTQFSTLGGNMANRDARKMSDELILVLKNKH